MPDHAKPEETEVEVTHVEDVQDDSALPAPLKGNLTSDVKPPQHEEPPQGEDVKPASHEEPEDQGAIVKPAGAGQAQIEAGEAESEDDKE